jgi:photosystem II stability/assembly factor-like uncharacterized protein
LRSGFVDALAFWDAEHGLVLGDPVGGRFTILLTGDGGATWARVPPEALPPALENEGAFAASGTCLVVFGDRFAWFATGGATVSRVFRSTDRGRTWSVAATPVRAGGPSAGIFSLAFRDERHGVAVGGDYKAPEQAGGLVARTEDGGKTWSAVGQGPGGYRSGVAFVPGTNPTAFVAVGPTGSDLSTDDGRGWKPLDVTGFHAVSVAPDGTPWAVGDGGRVARFVGSLR